MIDDYGGPFAPAIGIASLSRRALASLGREYMLFGHLLNRAALPWVHIKLGGEAREALAIEEWMGASPVYTQRMQRAFRFPGDDVETILKGMQLDVGFAHQYMDVRYALDGAGRGSFWLPSCGALLEVEPHGEAAVFSMCHAIEDPTFDATAVATNPRARVRPVHRPPRRPADRVPHCEWQVLVQTDAEPVEEIELTRRVRASRLAGVELTRVAEDGTGGRPDYSGSFEPDLQLESFSRAALVTACSEFLVQNHLLVRSLMTTLADRGGAEVAREIGMAQWMGAGAAAAARLHASLGIAGDGAEAILKVLQLHPSFLPGYTRVGLELAGAGRGRLWLEDCDALSEGDAHSWFALLDEEPHRALSAIVQAVNPRARCRAVTPPRGARHAWDIVVDPAAEPASVAPEVAMVRDSGTARFRFTPRPLAA